MKRIKKGLLYFICDVIDKFVCINWFLLYNTALILFQYLIFCIWLVTVYFLLKSCELLFQNNVKFCSVSSKKINLNLLFTWNMFHFFVNTFVKYEYVFCKVFSWNKLFFFTACGFFDWNLNFSCFGFILSNLFLRFLKLLQNFLPFQYIQLKNKVCAKKFIF